MSEKRPTNDQIIDSYVTWKIREGWALGYRASNGCQFTKPKQWNKVGLIFGLVLLPFWGIGLIFWVLTLLDYLIAKDKTMFVSVTQMEAQLRARRS